MRSADRPGIIPVGNRMSNGLWVKSVLPHAPGCTVARAGSVGAKRRWEAATQPQAVIIARASASSYLILSHPAAKNDTLPCRSDDET